MSTVYDGPLALDLDAAELEAPGCPRSPARPSRARSRRRRSRPARLVRRRRPAGMNRTRSRPSASRASSAIARWPRWIGSNVPPNEPERAAHGRDAARDVPAVTGPPTSSAPTRARSPPIRTVSPGRTPGAAQLVVDARAARGRAGTARPTPRRRSSSGRRAARSACRGPGTRRRRRARRVNPSPIASMRWTTTPAGSGGSASSSASTAAAPRSRARSSSRPSPVGGGDARRPAAPRPRARRRNAGHASRGRRQVELVEGDEHRLLEQRRVVRLELLADDLVVPLGSRDAPSTTWTSTRVRSTWRRNAWPRPAPGRRALDQPGHVGDRRPSLVLVAEVHARRGSARAS